MPPHWGCHSHSHHWYVAKRVAVQQNPALRSQPHLPRLRVIQVTAGINVKISVVYAASLASGKYLDSGQQKPLRLPQPVKDPMLLHMSLAHHPL